MFSTTTLIVIIVGYIGVLYAIANWAESSSPLAKRWSSSATVYILSIAVYCTSWTFYGSVGLASRSGIIVYTIYLGPTLLMIMLWPLMRRILLIKQTYHVNSIADFLSARFNRSLYLAGVTSIVAMIGIVPYLALQLKSINNTIMVVLGTETTGAAITWVIWFGVALFTIIFGIRHIDPTERHPGMMLALAVEGLVKLFAMLAVGLFVCFVLFDSPSQIFSMLEMQQPEAAKAMAQTPDFMTWISYLLLAGSAFFLLPRQFHVMVIENPKIKYIRQAQWKLPIYLILMTMFVMPISAAGILLLGPDSPDTYMLALPMSERQFALTLLVFIGGFSASMAMLMVSGMTLSTMFCNHLALPLLRRYSPQRNFGQYLLQIRWFAVFLVLGAGQAFYLFLGESYLLANMGMISFCAALQFLPLMLTGLYWKDVNSKGAVIGLSAGFLVWAYCLFIPSLMKSGWIDDSLLQAGPFGIMWLHPEHLFGSSMSRVTHGAFWSMLANISGVVLGSLFCKESKQETRYNAEFIDTMTQNQSEEDVVALDLPKSIELAPKTAILTELFERYFPKTEAAQKLEYSLIDAKLGDASQITTLELANLEKAAERHLSGATGAAMAHVLIRDSLLFTEEEMNELEQTYSQLLTQLKINPLHLRQQLNYAKEKELLAQEYNEQLETLVDQRTNELQDAMCKLQQTQSQLVEKEKQASLGGLVAGVAHEINTPIGICVTASSNLQEEVKALKKAYSSEQLSEQDLLDFLELCDESALIIHKNNERASELISSFKRIAVDQSSDELRQFELKHYLEEIMLSLRPQLKKVPHTITVDCPQEVHCSSYAGTLSQIFTNLIMNSIIHAFHPEQKGNINIRIENRTNEVEIQFQDDGKGLEEGDAKRLFDPFFTTKRNQGGSGLGTHLIHTLITRKMRGNIEIKTAPGEGLSYTINFPKIINEA
ncbi:sodium:proline symporter [Vibrio sp. SCSIO 43135]|uniref:ATP-binding protein n=1 Tax=Vibrio sp. SCSIO 43135 TaxID=2819096 RepID=UPI0020762458|nr:ATP-binding protein [Vibrio sp. SCSIO 43135]USD42341.1 sodium:proline symporter [Vibrio sp. SCSIO 43135]